MMLITNAFEAIMQRALAEIDTLKKNRPDIERFSALCTVLHEQGSAFVESLDVSEFEIDYHIRPAQHSDYLAIREALNGMGMRRAARTPNGKCDIIISEPDAPMFWLHIPIEVQA